jgi:hypothetical protein
MGVFRRDTHPSSRQKRISSKKFQSNGESLLSVLDLKKIQVRLSSRGVASKYMAQKFIKDRHPFLLNHSLFKTAISAKWRWIMTEK